MKSNRDTTDKIDELHCLPWFRTRFQFFTCLSCLLLLLFSIPSFLPFMFQTLYCITSSFLFSLFSSFNFLFFFQFAFSFGLFFELFFGFFLPFLFFGIFGGFFFLFFRFAFFL